MEFFRSSDFRWFFEDREWYRDTTEETVLRSSSKIFYYKRKDAESAIGKMCHRNCVRETNYQMMFMSNISFRNNNKTRKEAKKTNLGKLLARLSHQRFLLNIKTERANHQQHRHHHTPIFALRAVCCCSNIFIPNIYFTTYNFALVLSISCFNSTLTNIHLLFEIILFSFTSRPTAPIVSLVLFTFCVKLMFVIVVGIYWATNAIFDT